MDTLQENKSNTLVLGATPNTARYANIAANRLLEHGHAVTLLGIKEGEIAGIPILNGMPELSEKIDTVTLYVGASRQPAYYDYLMSLKPARIIFNPGTENAELMELCRKNGIEVVVGCTLVMLSVGTY